MSTCWVAQPGVPVNQPGSVQQHIPLAARLIGDRLARYRFGMHIGHFAQRQAMPGPAQAVARARGQSVDPEDAFVAYLKAYLAGKFVDRFGGVVAQRYGSDVHTAYGVKFTSTWKTVDSFWLHLLVESGALGTLAFLAILLVPFVLARRRLFSGQGPPEQRILCLAVMMLVPAHFVINLSAMALEANATSAVLWAIVGLALAPPPDEAATEDEGESAGVAG